MPHELIESEMFAHVALLVGDPQDADALLDPLKSRIAANPTAADMPVVLGSGVRVAVGRILNGTVAIYFRVLAPNREVLLLFLHFTPHEALAHRHAA